MCCDFRELRTVKIVKLKPDATLPSYKTSGSAGMDLEAYLDHKECTRIVLSAGSWCLVPTKLAIQLPRGLEAQVRPRSGLALDKGITVLNAPGTIDSDYTGEIQVMLVNQSDKNFIILHKMRIAQLVIAPVIQCVWDEVTTLEETSRGAGGFGHTGI